MKGAQHYRAQAQGKLSHPVTTVSNSNIYQKKKKTSARCIARAVAYQARKAEEAAKKKAEEEKEKDKGNEMEVEEEVEDNELEGGEATMEE